MKILIYDVESYKNLFCVTFYDYNTKEINVFKMTEVWDDTKELINFIKGCDYLVGYNNKKYDDIILNYIIKHKPDAEDIYKLSNLIISNRNTNWRDLPEDIAKNTHNFNFKSIDLMKLLGFDKLKIGLKNLMVKMNWHIIQDLPYKYDSILEPDEWKEVIKYNLNDVLFTNELCIKCSPELNFRFGLEKIYNLDLLSSSNANLGDKLLNKLYAEKSGKELYEFRDLRTVRHNIEFKNIIDDKISFVTPEMNKMFEVIKSYKYHSHIPAKDELYDLIFKGKRYTIALGGLHSANPPKIYKQSTDYKIVSCDVGSYYPQILINRNAYPEHLGKEFIPIYENIKNDRIKAKKEKGSKSVEAESLKILLNQVFGKLGFEHYWLQDLKALYNITINGQLYLLILIEQLEINNFEVIAANTDGLEVIVPNNKLELYYSICKEWEEKYNYSLEYIYYSNLVINNVNNYISIESSDSPGSPNKVKEKGLFLTHRSKISIADELKRAKDKPIIAESLFQYFINGIKPIETIKNCNNIFDFCMSEKADNKFQMEYHKIKIIDEQPIVNIEILQKTNRYFISKSGGSLIKRNKENNKFSRQAGGNNIRLLNEYIEQDIKYYDIDTTYYMKETMKIIQNISNNFQTNLF